MLPSFTAPVTPARPMISQGQHVGRIYSVIILGTVPDTYMGVTKQMLKAQITIETDQHHQFDDGVKPLVYSQKFTLSMGDKASLRKFVNQVLGQTLNDAQAKTFNVFSLIDKSINVVVSHVEKQNGNGMKEVLTSIMPLMNGQQPPQPFNPILYWYYDAPFLASPDAVAMWDRIPPYMKNEILLSEEIKANKAHLSQPLRDKINAYVQERAAKQQQQQQPAPQAGYALPNQVAPQYAAPAPAQYATPVQQQQYAQPVQQTMPPMVSNGNDDDLPF